MNRPRIFRRRFASTPTGVLKKRQPTFSLTFLINITPGCDCTGFSDVHIVPDIGTLASYDAVAIDQAAVGLVNQQQGLLGTKLKKNVTVHGLQLSVHS